MDEIMTGGFSDSSPSVEYEKMKAELERDRANILNESRNFVAEVRDSIVMTHNVPYHAWTRQWDEPMQSTQNLHPKKTEKVNWQEEGF